MQRHTFLHLLSLIVSQLFSVSRANEMQFSGLKAKFKDYADTSVSEEYNSLGALYDGNNGGGDAGSYIEFYSMKETRQPYVEITDQDGGHLPFTFYSGYAVFDQEIIPGVLTGYEISVYADGQLHKCKKFVNCEFSMFNCEFGNSIPNSPSKLIVSYNECSTQTDSTCRVSKWDQVTNWLPSSLKIAELRLWPYQEQIQIYNPTAKFHDGSNAVVQKQICGQDTHTHDHPITSPTPSSTDQAFVEYDFGQLIHLNAVFWNNFPAQLLQVTVYDPVSSQDVMIMNNLVQEENKFMQIVYTMRVQNLKVKSITQGVVMDYYDTAVLGEFSHPETCTGVTQDTIFQTIEVYTVSQQTEIAFTLNDSIQNPNNCNIRRQFSLMAYDHRSLLQLDSISLTEAANHVDVLLYPMNSDFKVLALDPSIPMTFKLMYELWVDDHHVAALDQQFDVQVKQRCQTLEYAPNPADLQITLVQNNPAFVEVNIRNVFPYRDFTDCKPSDVSFDSSFGVYSPSLARLDLRVSDTASLGTQTVHFTAVVNHPHNDFDDNPVQTMFHENLIITVIEACQSPWLAPVQASIFDVNTYTHVETLSGDYIGGTPQRDGIATKTIAFKGDVTDQNYRTNCGDINCYFITAGPDGGPLTTGTVYESGGDLALLNIDHTSTMSPVSMTAYCSPATSNSVSASKTVSVSVEPCSAASVSLVITDADDNVENPPFVISTTTQQSASFKVTPQLDYRYCEFDCDTGVTPYPDEWSMTIANDQMVATLFSDTAVSLTSVTGSCWPVADASQLTSFDFSFEVVQSCAARIQDLKLADEQGNKVHPPVIATTIDDTEGEKSSVIIQYLGSTTGCTTTCSYSPSVTGLTFDSQALEFTLQSSTTIEGASVTVSCRINETQDPPVKLTFNIEVGSACSPSELLPDFPVLPIDYEIDSESPFEFETSALRVKYDDPICDDVDAFDLTVEVRPEGSTSIIDAEWLVYDAGTQKLKIKTDDEEDAGNYDLTISVSDQATGVTGEIIFKAFLTIKDADSEESSESESVPGEEPPPFPNREGSRFNETTEGPIFPAANETLNETLRQEYDPIQIAYQEDEEIQKPRRGPDSQTQDIAFVVESLRKREQIPKNVTEGVIEPRLKNLPLKVKQDIYKEELNQKAVAQISNETSAEELEELQQEIEEAVESLEEGEALEIIDGEVIVYPESYDSVTVTTDEETGETIAVVEFNPFTDPRFVAQKKKKKENARQGIIQEKVLVQTGTFQPDGSVTMEFNQELTVPRMFLVEDEEIEQTGRRLEGNSTETKQTTIKYDIDISNYFSIEFIQSPDSFIEPEELNFKVKVTSFETKSISLGFEFENPLLVSSGAEPDIIEIKFTNPSLFVSQSSGESIAQDYLVTKVLPKLTSLEAAQALHTTAVTIEAVTNTIVIVQIIVSLIMSASLKSMWNLYNVIQVIVYIRLIVSWPANGATLMDLLEDGITMRKVINPVMEFGVSSFSSLNQTLDDAALQKKGIDNPSLFKSLGIFGISIVVILMLVGVLWLLRKLKTKYSLIQRLTDLLRKKLFYNGFLRYMVTGYLKLCHSGLAFLVTLSFATTSKGINSVVAMLITALCVAWPIFVACWMEKYKDVLEEDKDLEKKFGTMYQGIKTDERASRWYTSVFSVRRFLLVASVVFLPNYLFLRIQCFCWLQSAYIIYIGWWDPHKEAVYNRLEEFNEFSLFVVGYHLFIFTPWVEPAQQYTMGWTASAMICAIILVNFSLMARNLYRKLKMKDLQKKYNKHILGLKEEKVKEQSQEVKQALALAFTGRGLNAGGSQTLRGLTSQEQHEDTTPRKSKYRKRKEKREVNNEDVIVEDIEGEDEQSDKLSSFPSESDSADEENRPDSAEQIRQELIEAEKKNMKMSGLPYMKQSTRKKKKLHMKKQRTKRKKRTLGAAADTLLLQSYSSFKSEFETPTPQNEREKLYMTPPSADLGHSLSNVALLNSLRREPSQDDFSRLDAAHLVPSLQVPGINFIAKQRKKERQQERSVDYYN